MKDASNPDLTVKVTAFQWAWQYDYLQDGVSIYARLSTPRSQIEEWQKKGDTKEANYLLEVDNPMVVPAGKKVRLLITSNDVIHGWYVPQLGVNQYGIPGFVKDTWFKADKPGTYRGQCSQICGKEHGFMPIVVVAKTPEEYAAWVKAAEGEDAAAAAGRSPPPASSRPPGRRPPRRTRTRSGRSTSSRRRATRSTPPTARPATRRRARACRPPSRPSTAPRS